MSIHPSIPLVISIVSAIVSVFSFYTSYQGMNYNKSNNLRNAISTYIENFKSVIKDENFLTEDGFKKLSYAEKRHVEIVNGLLVTVIDVMHEVNDPRAESWTGYLEGIKGPLSNGYPLETYSSNEKTIKSIKELRQRILENQK